MTIFGRFLRDFWKKWKIFGRNAYTQGCGPNTQGKARVCLHFQYKSPIKKAFLIDFW